MRTIDLFTFFLIFQCGKIVSARCVDGENNLLKAADVGSDNVIKALDLVGKFYDSKEQPSCYKNTVDFKFPGFVKIISGRINITKQLNFSAVPGTVKLLLTVKKNDFLVGYICKDGKSETPLLEDRDCNSDICDEYEEICKLLQIPGIHSFEEVLKYLNLNSTIAFPSPHGVTDVFLRGQWKFEVKLKIGDEIIGHVKAPSDQTWIWGDE